MNTHSITELTQRLITSLNSHYDIIDMETVLYVIKELERTRITKEQLETTRIARYINQLRKRTKSENLAKRSKELLKKWHDIFIPIATTQPANTGVQFALIPETSTSRSQTNSRKKHQNGDNSNTFAIANNDPVINNNISHMSNNFLSSTNKLPTSFANLLPTSSANAIKSSQNSDMMVNDAEQNLSYLYYKNNSSKNLIYEYEQNSNQSAVDNSKNNRLYGTGTMQNLMDNKEYALNQASKNRLYGESQNIFNAESITIGLSDSNSHKSFHGKDQQIGMPDNFQTGNDIMPVIINKLNKKHKKDKKQKRDKEKNIIQLQNKIVNSNNVPRAISKCKNNAPNAYVMGKLNNLIPINEDDVDEIVLKTINYNQSIPTQYQQQQQQQQIQQQNNRELLSISNSSLSIFSIQNETNDDHDGSSFNQKHMDLTFSGKFNPMSTSIVSRGNDLDTVSNKSQPIELSSPGIKSCTNKNEYASIVILDESSRSCSPFTNTLNNHLSKLPIELVSNVSRTQNLNENSQNSNTGLTMLKREVTTANCDINDKTVQNLDLADNLIKNTIASNAVANKTIAEEKIPKKRGRKKGSKGIDSLLAQSIQYTKSSQQQLLDQSTRLLSGAATSMIIGGNSSSNKKVKTTKELLAAIQNRKAYGNSQQGQMIQSTTLSPTLPQYTEQQNQLQDSRPVSFCSDGSRSPIILEIAPTNRIDADVPGKGNSIENSIFVDDSTDSEATTKSNFNTIAKNGPQKHENDLEIKSTETSFELQNDIAILSTEDKILQLFSQLPKMPKNFLNEVDLNYLNSIPCTCKIRELDLDLDKENLTENGEDITKTSPDCNKLDITNQTNIPIDISPKIKQYPDFNLDVDGDKTSNSNDDWFITNLSNNNACRKSPILGNSNSIIPDQLNFKGTEKTVQYPIKRSIFDSDYDEADDPLHKLVEEQKKIKEETKKDKLIKHKNKSKRKYIKSLDFSDNEAANSGNSFDSNENFDDSRQNFNFNSEGLQNLDDSINFNSNLTSIGSDFMEVDQCANNEKEDMNTISPVKLTTISTPLGFSDNSVKLIKQENLPDAELQNLKKLQVISDENCLARKKYILKPKNISLLYINLLHNYYVPNVNGNWSTLSTGLEEIENSDNVDIENIEKSVKTMEETFPKSEESTSKIDGVLQLENTDNSPLESLNVDASQTCDRKSVIAPTDCIECNKKENSLDELCEIHSSFETQIKINKACNEQLHERVVPLYSHLIQDKIQKKFNTLKLEEYNLKLNDSLQRICLKCNKKRKFQFKLNKPTSIQCKTEENQNSCSFMANTDYANFLKSRLPNEDDNFNFSSYPSELDTKCDLLNIFNILNSNSMTKSGSNDETNCGTRIFSPDRYFNDLSKSKTVVQNCSNKISGIDFNINEIFSETISISNSKKYQTAKNTIEFQNKVLTETDNTKESNELNSMFQNDSNEDYYEPQVKKLKLKLSGQPIESIDMVSSTRISPIPSDLELKLKESESSNFINTFDSTEEVAPEKLRRSSNCSNTSLKQTQNSINLKLKSRLKEKQLRKEKKEQCRSSDIEADDNYESPSSSDQDHLSDNCSSDDETNSSSCDDNSIYSTSSTDNPEDDSERDDSENLNQDYHEVVRHDMKTSSKTGNKHIVLTIKKTPIKPTTRILPTTQKTGALKLNIKIGGDQSNDSITEKNKSQREINKAVNLLENEEGVSRMSDETVANDDIKRISSKCNFNSTKAEFNTNFQLSSKHDSDDDDDYDDDDDDKFQIEPLKIHTENSCQIRKLERLSIELNSIDDNLNLNANSKNYDLAPHNVNLTRKYFRELRRINRLKNRMQTNLKENVSTESNHNELDENFQQLPTENQESNQELNISSVFDNTTNKNPNSYREKKPIRNRDQLFFPDEIYDGRSQLIFNQDCEDKSGCSCSSCCYSTCESEDDLNCKNDSKILRLDTEISETDTKAQIRKSFEHDANRLDVKLYASNNDDDEENYCKCSESDTEVSLNTEVALNTETPLSTETNLNHSAVVNSEFEPTIGDNNNNSDESLNKLDASCEINSENCNSNCLIESKTDLELNTIILNKNNDMLESFNSTNLNEPEQLKYSNKEFKEWHEVLKLVSYDNQPLTILPYVIID